MVGEECGKAMGKLQPPQLANAIGGRQPCGATTMGAKGVEARRGGGPCADRASPALSTAT